MKYVTAAAALAALLTAYAGSTPRDLRESSVTKRDFFFYSCVHEYMKANGIRNFDGSLAYAVEYSSFSAEELTRLHDAAKRVAAGIGAPDYTDPEHGLSNVFVSCERGAAKATQ